MNLIFNASAGTGKTWQVTELYTALVLGSPHDELPADRAAVDPRRILLMTFTDNAASELRQRVSEKMIAAEKAAFESDHDELADRARRVLRSLPVANISTIHAFCAGLLRENALELGLSPSFQTLEDEERDALLDEVLKAEIFQCLGKIRSAGATDFRDFCAGLSVLSGDYSVLNTIRALLEKAASRGLDLSHAEAMLPPPECTVTKKNFERIRDELADFGLSQKTVLDALDALNRFLGRFPDGIEGLRKFGRVKAVQHLSDELFELKERFLTETLYAENVGKFQAFARCLARCAAGFTEAKRSSDAVDFGDQLLLARDLLKNKKFAEPLFDWIIVDEVQDTSRVQCEVIEALWGRNAQLVICGDKKQSIYAWRSADPNVMPDLEDQMAARGEYKQIPLKVSRRSKDRVIDAVNELFDGIYDPYDALEPLDSLGNEKPCVEFLMPDDEEQGSEEEMAAVARRIRLLVDGDAEWRPRFGHDGARFVEGQSFDYGDILILLKRSTHQAVLEKALREAGVPYTSGGKGRALFEQQEVRDLLLFLQVITQPRNELALVGFLRSPFANLTDDEIVTLGWDGETFDHEILRKQFFESASIVGQASLYSESLCEDTRSQVRDSTKERETSLLQGSDHREWQPHPTSVSEVAERILRYRSQIGKKRPSQLIREIVRETAFDAQLAGQSGGEQKLANFKKALDWIRGAERGGKILIGDGVRRFEKYIKTPPRSGAAEALLPDPAQNAVTLMTVHGAKGLTQRVCFVPDISFGDQSEKGFAVFGEKTMELKVAGLNGDEIKSPGWNAAREADKAVRKKESDNVFYVAMTRARDLVVLSGAGTKKPVGWLKRAEGFLAGAAPEVLRTVMFSDLTQVDVDEKKGLRPEALDLREKLVFQPLEVLQGNGQKTEVWSQTSEVGYVPLKVPAGFERRTVTSLIENPRPKAHGLKSPKDRRSFGTVGHAVLEELAKNRWGGNIPELVERFSGESGSVETEPLIPQLEAARVVLREETNGAIALFAEHPFVLKRGNTILDGTIDLLVQKSFKVWKVLDYKFSSDSPESVLETYAPQLVAYKEAVGKLNPGAEVSAALVLIGAAVQVISLRG